jgi:hydrogenase assembly chaperone HypC/HupF
MCLTLPVEVIEVHGSVAIVEAGGRRREASTLAVPSVEPGDWAILAAGSLVRVLDPYTARELVSAFHLATGQGGQP